MLYGHLPGFELSHDFFPQPDDLIWSPADWAWMGGLFDVLMPGLFHGRPVLAFQTTKFDPELAFDLIPRLGVRNVFMPATALRMMAAHDGPALSLRTLASGGEMVGEETAAWCSERLGARLNEFYGQTEANLLIGNSAAWPAKPGSMGRAYPGHDVQLVDGEVTVAVDGDPVVFLGYWRNEAATAEKVRDGRLHTGDLAEVDDDGYFNFVGRTDDLISSAGHRIGPGEIEECLVRHPAVTLAAVIGVPDELRGETIKAFVVATSPSEALAAELQALVRERLAAYEVPREIEFVDELPLTTSGKIRRNELERRSHDATTLVGPRCDTLRRSSGPTRTCRGCLLAKTGPTANVAAAGAELKGVRGIVITSIGYDIRKFGGFASPLGSHCGAGAPRFNVVTAFGTHFIGCASPPPISQVLGQAWTRMAWSTAAAFPPIPPGAAVETIDIVFDEGTDTGPDNFGIAILDNIMVNGVAVGRRTA